MAIVQADRQNLRVFIDGMQILGLFRAAIARTNCFSADTFALTFVMGIEPLHDIKFWSAVSSAFVEVFITDRYRSDDLSLISGHVDNIFVNPVESVVAIEGRDLSSLMIDSYRQQDFVNQTASEIVSAIALQHGLAPTVVSTTGSVGRYYDDGYTKLSLGQFSRLRSDWDLVVQLARQNGFDPFVGGRSLFFRPTNIALNTVFPLSVRDVRSVRIERSLNIRKNTAAKVRSWDSQYMKAYESSATKGS